MASEKFLKRYKVGVDLLKTVRAASGWEERLADIIDAMTRLQERLERGEVEYGELVALSRGYVDSLTKLREDSSEARVRARPEPQPTPSEVEARLVEARPVEVRPVEARPVEARPVEDEEDEERVDSIAKSMTDLWAKMEGGQVDKEELIQLLRGFVSGLEALRGFGHLSGRDLGRHGTSRGRI